MMFSLSFALLVLTALGATGQINDNNVLQEQGYPFGKLRLSNDGKNEELIPSSDFGKSQLSQDQSSNGQPLSSPCNGVRAFTKFVYPTDKTKYLQCRDEFHYEIFTCPNGANYNEQTNSCEFTTPIIGKCEQEKPCFNDGQCSLISNSTFKCTCRPDWTGDRCETPVNACVRKPCGPDAECRPFKASDYEKDYVCLCNDRRFYGPNCQQTVANPCLTNIVQFFPFAYSQSAYVQCDEELIYFQPCAASLYWNQQEKFCDRKRQPKIDLVALLAKLVSQSAVDKQSESVTPTVIEEKGTVAMPVEQKNTFTQGGSEAYFAFAPARVVNRQQLLSNINNQQVGLSQNLRDKEQELPSQSGDSNQMRQDFTSNAKQRPNQQFRSDNQQIEVNRGQPLTLQSEQWSQNTQQQRTPISIETLSMDSNVDQQQRGTQSQIRQDNQQQNLPQQKQVFGSQQWLNQIPDTNTQNNEQFAAQPQSVDFKKRTIVSQTQPRQGSQIFQNQQQLSASMPEGTSPDTKNRLSTGIQQSNQFGSEQQNTQNLQQWQNKGTNQIRQNLNAQPEGLFTEVQRLRLENQQPLTSQSVQTQQRTPTFNSESSADLNNGQIQRVQTQIRQDNQQQNFPQQQQQQAFGSQQWLNQVPNTNTQNNQRFVAQSQGSQSIQNPSRSEFIETTTEAQNVVQLQGFANPISREQERSWQNIPLSQSVDFKTQNIVPQTQSWQSSQTFQTQPQISRTISEGTSFDNKNRLNTGIQQNNQLGSEQQNTQWQNKGTNQIRQTLNAQPEVSFTEVQRLRLDNQQPLTSQSVRTQQRIPTFNSESSADLNNGQIQRVQSQIRQDNQPQNIPQQKQVFGSQQWLNQVPNINTQNNQQFVGQTQSSQGSQTIQNQPRLEIIDTTTTTPQNLVQLQGYANQNSREPEQSWQNKLNTQQIQSQPVKLQSNLIFAFQPKQWLQTPKQNQQVFSSETSFPSQSTQYGVNQQGQNFAGQSSFLQKQLLPNNNQQMPIEQQSTTDQRRTLDSMPSSVSTSWKPRAY